MKCELRMKKCPLVALLVLISCMPMSAQKRSATLRIDVNTKYQHIDGFGGTGMNGQWSDVYTQDKVNKLWGTGDNQMGYNIMRIRINPNEGNWGEYGNPIKWARKVNPHLHVFATPWTPPKKYKTSKTTKYQNEFGTWVWPLVEHSWGGQGSNGGAINPDSIDAYADFLNRYRLTMKKKGCPIDMISIQNESDYTPTTTDNGVEKASYESCIFSPKEMARMVKAVKDLVGDECKVMGPECFGWNQHNYNNQLVAIPDAANSIDVWGNHLYGLQNFTHVNTITKKTGKPMWQTEYYVENTKGTWEAEYDFIENVENTLANGFSAYVYYNMLNDFFGDGTDEDNHNQSSSTLYKRAYVFSHYAKFATGKRRVKLTISDGNSTPLTGSAFVSETGDTVTVFVLNKSSKEYNMRVILPFTTKSVVRAVSGESANRIIQDVSAEYAGVKNPTLSVLPGMFYTFQFVEGEYDPSDPSQFMLAESSKTIENGNPLTPLMYLADPTAVEYEGRLYVYGTYDQQQFDYCDGLLANDYSKITKLAMLSTDDLVNWTFHGLIDVGTIAPWIYTSWAPSAVCREESDGKTHFYLYFTNSASGIGVLTSTSPVGPWTDPLGKALIDGKTAGLGTISNLIDPGVVIDDDGIGWLAFGGGSPNASGTTAQPGNARIVKLGDDMISLASDIVQIPAPYHFEANELNVMGGKLVFSYCSSWSASDACCIRYMSTSDPLEGTWKDKGVYFKNPGSYGYPYGNNHTHLQKFGNFWYLVYHTQWLENERGFSGGYRGLALNRATVVEKSQKVAEVKATDTGNNQLSSNRVRPTQIHEAEMMANAGYGLKMSDYDEVGNEVVEPIAGQWTAVRGVTFEDEQPNVMKLRIQGTGKIEIYFDEINEDPLGTASFSSEEMEWIEVELDSQKMINVQNIFFLFREAKDVKWDKWTFGDTPTDVNDVKVKRYNGEEVYNLSGQRVGADYKGIVIKNGTKILIK